MEGTELTTIPKMRRVYKDTKANLDALTGLRNEDLGYATDETILYRQNGDGAANWETITSGPGELAVGDILMVNSITMQTTAVTSYTKVKEIMIGLDGNIRVSFLLKMSATSGDDTAFGKIYKNGSAVGIERSTQSGNYTTFSEDFTGIIAGDQMQLYLKTTNGIRDSRGAYFKIFVAGYAGGIIDID